MERDLVDLLDDLAAAKHDDISIAADAAEEIRRMREAMAKILRHMERNGMGDWPVARAARKALEPNES